MCQVAVHTRRPDRKSRRLNRSFRQSTERLYAYGRFLLLKLPHRDSAQVGLGVDVRLDFYRLSLTGQMSLGLGMDDVTLGRPSEVGTAGPEPPLVPLSSIIAALNDRFGTDFTLTGQLVFDQIEEELVANAELARQAQVNRIDNYKYGFDRAFLTALIGRKSQNEQIFARMLNEPAFAEAVKAQMIGAVYRRQNEPPAAPTF